MASSDHLSQRRPSHALPSPALKTSASASSASFKQSHLLRTPRQIHGRNIKNLAERARQRRERCEEVVPKFQASPKPAAFSSPNSPSRLPDVEDNQTPRNSAVYRRCTNDLSPCPHSASSSNTKGSFRGHGGHFSHILEAIDHEEDVTEAKLQEADALGRSHGSLNDNGLPDLRKTLWQTISALSVNQKRLIIARSMQEILCHAVSMYYCGMGDRVLAELDEAQEKARRMELRVINGQAQLWRAIILDEVGETESIAELLADALFLLAAGTSDTLSFAEIPPEDADFYQLWRMVWGRNYWYSLWKYLKTEDAKENMHIPTQDLESKESKEEALEWALRFLNQLKTCFDHSKWPGFDRGRISVRFSRVNDMSLHQSRGGPVVQQIRTMAQRLHELEVKDRERMDEIERLRINNMRYKAEREVFDTNLSTGRTYNGIYPRDITDESVKHQSRPISVASGATDKNFGFEQDLIREHDFTEPRLSAALSPDQVDLFNQRMRNGDAKGTEQIRHSRLITQKSPPTIPPSVRQSTSIQRSLRDKSYDKKHGSQLPGPHERISLWAHKTHGEQVRSIASSQTGYPVSPNSIAPSSPASGRSWRRVMSPYDASPESAGQLERERPQGCGPAEPSFKTNISPTRACRANNVLPSPITHLTDSVASSTPQLSGKNTSPAQVGASFRTLYEELADVLSLKSDRGTHVFTSTASDSWSSVVEDPLLLQEHENDQIHTKPVFHVPSYNISKLKTSKSRGFRAAERSPECISPLANPEDFRLTDTPGGDQLQETLFNIRAHQEQRKRSMSDFSPISEGLNKRALTQENESDTYPLAQQDGQTSRKTDNSSAGGSDNLSAYNNESQMRSLGDSPSKDDRGAAAASDAYQEETNVENTGNVLDRGRHASLSDVKRSRSTEDRDQQLQPLREANVDSAKSLKLQVPQLVTSSDHHRRASVAPASPSPLRTSFSQSAASEDPEFMDEVEGSG